MMLVRNRVQHLRSRSRLGLAPQLLRLLQVPPPPCDVLPALALDLGEPLLEPLHRLLQSGAVSIAHAGV